MLIQAQGALAQFTPDASATQPAESIAETIVSAPRGETSGGIAPLLELSPSELESYGVDTLGDLVDALKPMTRSSRSDKMPVVLINGHLAGQIEFENLPREAIARVEVLPETVALQYGFSENQRVLNFILREHYRAVPARLSDSGATEGGSQMQSADASFVRLEDEARATLLASYRGAAWLRASDREIDLPDNYALTLQPATTDTSIAGTLSRAILGVSSSIEASLGVGSSRSLQGVAAVGSDSPAADLAVPLEQDTHASTARVAAQLTGQLGHFIWGATSFYTYQLARSSSEVSFNLDGDALSAQTHATLNTGNLQLSLSGPATRLPAGPIIANLKFGLQYQGFDTENTSPGAPVMHSNLVRTVRSGNFNANVPLASPDQDSGLKLGQLSGTFNVTLDNVSDFGALWSVSYGLDWIPVGKVHLDAFMTDHQTAPTVQQVLAPPIITPNVEMFDFVTGETAYVTEINGGGGNLNPTDDRVGSFGVSLGPFMGKTVFSAHYEQNRIRNAIGLLPPLTADVEQAFPERFVRDSTGALVEVDERWVNLARESTDDVKWGFNLWVPLGAVAPNRFEVSLFDTWYLRDSILIRDGIPELNLLNGAPFDLAGGQPDHKVELRSLLYKDGYGAALSSAWRSPTTVGSGVASAPDVIFYSALGTVDLRLFADFERIHRTQGHAWAKGASVSLAVTNLFDQRQTVHDSSGATPAAFAPGYLDPAGRLLAIGFRKVF